MAVTYILRDTTSDLSGGADFNLNLTSGSAGTSNPLGVTVSGGATDISFAWTTSGLPGTNGATGNYTVEINVTGADSNFQLSVQLHRVNSSGTIQTSSSVSSEQSGGSTGVKTFNYTSLSLGTWASGDRLRVDYRFRNTGSHGNNTITIDRNTTSCEVVTPFTPPPQNINLGLVTGTNDSLTATRRKSRAAGLTEGTNISNTHTRLKSRRMNPPGYKGA